MSTHNYHMHNYEITFKYFFNESINEYYNILAQCNTLRFAQYSQFNKPLTIPPSITNIHFGDRYEQLTFLTHNLIIVVLGFNFNQPIILTPNIEHFVMGVHFNQIIILPKNLKHIKTGYNFNKPMVLPKNIEEIYISDLFKHSLILPKYIKKCTIIGSPSQYELTKSINYLYVSLFQTTIIF